MYLQGQLQIVFDALYHLGIIDPVLEMDWREAIEDMNRCDVKVKEIVLVANDNQTDMETLIEKLNGFDEQSLGFLAMEVAREFADFHERGTLH